MDHDKFPNLRAYLGTMTVAMQAAFALECGTTVGYLRKFLSKGGGMDASTVAKIVINSAGRIPVIELRPDVRWTDLSRHIGSDALVPEKMPPQRRANARIKALCPVKPKAPKSVRAAVRAKLKAKTRTKLKAKLKTATALTQAASPAGAA